MVALNDLALSGLEILLVDDDWIVVEATRRVLSDLGASVGVARGARQALEHLADHPAIDLIVTDIRMPDVDGITFARQVRKTRPDLSIILLTAFADTSDLPGYEVLYKPCRSDELQATILRVLAKSNGRS